MLTVPLPSDPRFKNLTGIVFGRLRVTGYAGRIRKSHAFHCKCSCGGEITTRSCCLTMGVTRSCGCLLPDWIRENKTTHGLSATREWRLWSGMKTRCTNPKVQCYPRYGGAGVKVCDRWLYGDGERNGFECFYLDMGPRPTAKHSLDRYPDPAGNYEPGNCRWATRSQQAQNTRKKRIVEWGGQRKTPREWAEITGLPHHEISKRLGRGWTEERALTQPLRAR